MDRHSRGAQRVEVGEAVLLLVGDDEVGGERDDRVDVGVLGAADAPDVGTRVSEVGGVGAPVGGPDEQPGGGGGDGLGERRHDRDDPSNGRGDGHGKPEIVDDHKPTLRGTHNRVCHGGAPRRPDQVN